MSVVISRNHTGRFEPEEVSGILRSFWDSVMETRATAAGGVVMAVPLNYPDGWQVVIELQPSTATTATLSDGGRTLGRFFETGQNLDSRSRVTHDLLQERLSTFELAKNGLEIWRTVPLPPQGIDIHLFAEALVSIAHLSYRHEPGAESEDVAARTVERVFFERGVEVSRGVKLDGFIEPQVEIDYFLRTPLPVAMQIINRRGKIISLMEQWGYRWNDLRRKQPRLLPAMIYDPDRQQIDPVSKNIGREVCALFCAYHETERIHELVDRAQAG